jgi:hypothetical protein
MDAAIADAFNAFAAQQAAAAAAAVPQAPAAVAFALSLPPTRAQIGLIDYNSAGASLYRTDASLSLTLTTSSASSPKDWVRS